MKGFIVKIGLIFGLVFMLLLPNLALSDIEHSRNNIQQKDNVTLLVPTTEKTTVFSLYLFDTTGTKKHEVVLPSVDATELYSLFEELKHETTTHPSSQKTRQLEDQFYNLLMEKNVVQTEPSKEVYLSLLTSRLIERLQNSGKKVSFPNPFTNRGTCTFCSMSGGGTGVLIPLFLLPRPRIAMLWLGSGLTDAANLLTSKGFVAEGSQIGFAFGFIGVGISYAIPGSTLFGFIGYSLFTSTTAEYVAHYPPNRAPEISDVTPADGQQNVPLSLTELQFRIQDADGDLMSYMVTTDPDIGSASGNLKPFGVYTVPVSGLQELTKYTWHIQLTDGKDTTEETLTFATQAVSPIVSIPSPEDGERHVPSDLAALKFTLMDYQGDAMEYTVETSPSIGFAHASGVHDGAYTVPVNGVSIETAYRWFVNVTDGTHWTRKTFSFVTGFPAHFNPFEYGWHYRKQITIDHTNVAGDVQNFPVLLSITDTDLSQKARDQGEDILFMNGTGVSTRLNYEIESYTHETGALIAWVNIPHLLSSQDTTFSVYYGNPSCLPQQYPEKTWDSHYLAVFHMNNAQGAADSTDQHNATAGVDPIYHTAGKIGFAESFSGNQYLQIAHPSTMGGLSALTIEAWVKMNSDTTGSVITDMYDATYSGETWRFLYVKEQDSFLFRLGHSSPHSEEADGLAPGVVLETWYHFIGTWTNGEKASIYTDGILSDQSANPFSGMINRPDTDAFIGVEHSGSHTAFQNYLIGTADEIRVSNIARSPSWISTSYTNQNNPSGFLTVGPEVPGP